MLRQTFISFPLIIFLCWILLFLFGKQKKSNIFRFVTWILTTCFLTLLGCAILIYQAIDVFIYYQCVFILSALSIYPLFYTYVKLLTKSDESDMKLLYRLLPAIILTFFTFLTFVLSYLTDPEEMQPYMRQLFLRQNEGYAFSLVGNSRIVLYYVNHATFCVESVVYIILIFRELPFSKKGFFRYRANMADKPPVFSKMVYFIILLILLTGYLTVSYFIDRFNYSDNRLVISSIILSLLLFSIGFYSIRLFFTAKDFSMEMELTYNGPDGNLTDRHNDIAEWHKKNMLKERILELFEEKEIYKNQDLRIGDISNMLNTNRTYISNTINNNIGSNFPDFVNAYRVEYAKKLILESKMEMVSLMDIAEKSGFSNMNSFYRAFRRLEGLSPKQYLIQEIAMAHLGKRRKPDGLMKKKPGRGR